MPQLHAIEDSNLDREIIRQSLDAISADIGVAIRDAGLGAIPTYIVIPNSGNALATVMTPRDPSPNDWERIMEIACRVIQDKLGSGRLHTREMAWALANEPSVADEATADPTRETVFSEEGSAGLS